MFDIEEVVEIALPLLCFLLSCISENLLFSGIFLALGFLFTFWSGWLGEDNG